MGHVSFLWEGLAPWGRRMLEKNGKVFNLFFLGEHVTVIDWEVYERHVARAEDRGELVPQWPPNLMKLLGEHSVLSLRAGRGPECARHRLVKAKLMQSLAPRQVLLLAQRMETAARRVLDECVEETAGPRGEVSMKRLIDRYAYENAAVSVLGDLAEDGALLDMMQPLCDRFLLGTLGLVSIDLPVFAFGRSMDARRALAGIVRGLLTKSRVHDSRRNVLAQLTTESSAGRGLTEDEVVDTLLTVLIAGIVTTSFTIPHLVVNLWRQPAWAERIAAEARSMTWTEESSIEAPERGVLKFVRETMRQYPAIDVFRRAKADGPLDLGEYGTLPARWPFAVLFASDGYNMGDVFDPSRWTPEASRSFVGFGGHAPHQCAGKSLALLEMQIMAQVIAGGGYRIEVLDPSVVPLIDTAAGMHYKDGLRVKVTRG